MTVISHCVGFWALFIAAIVVTCTLSTFRAAPTTRMPSVTSLRVMLAPIPALAPVTRATRPAQRSILAAL